MSCEMLFMSFWKLVWMRERLFEISPPRAPEKMGTSSLGCEAENCVWLSHTCGVCVGKSVWRESVCETEWRESGENVARERECV